MIDFDNKEEARKHMERIEKRIDTLLRIIETNAEIIRLLVQVWKKVEEQ